MGVLAGDGDRPADVLLAVVAQVPSAERYASLLRVEEASSRFTTVVFPAPLAPSERDPSPGLEPQADPVEQAAPRAR